MSIIYINQIPVILATENTESLALSTRERLQITYRNQSELLPLIQYIENTPELREVRLVSSDLIQLQDDFYEHYSFVHASGGVVYNDQNELLLIFRNEKWDLPKGKVERNENFHDAALREITEETGVSHLHITGPICIDANEGDNVTYHTYYDTGRRILKITHWYSIYCNNAKPADLQPQIAEGISQVAWVSAEKIQTDGYFDNMYGSIKDVLRDFLEKNKKNEKKSPKNLQ